MLILLKVFLLLAALLVVQSVASLRDGWRFLRYVRRSLSAEPGSFQPSTAVIVPVKGLDEGFEVTTAELLAQDYPDYRLIFAVASEADAAYSYLAQHVANRSLSPGRGPREIKLVVAGHSRQRGEKVNNLLAGLRAVQPETAVLVFADADARPKTGWLRSLVAPLADPSVTVSTGFRWYLPGQTFGSRLRAAWDTSIAMLLGEHGRNFAWGGAMALRASDFRRLQVAERYWDATVSDDYAVTRAVRDAGGKIRFEPRCLMASAEELTLGVFWRWANRQIIITRVYAPRYWRLGLLSYALFCATFLLGLGIGLFSASALARVLALGLLAAILMLGLAKAGLRARVARQVFPKEADTLRRYGASYWRLWPLVPWVMLINFVTAGLMRRIEWRGTRYELVSATRLRVLESRD